MKKRIKFSLPFNFPSFIFNAILFLPKGALFLPKGLQHKFQGLFVCFFKVIKGIGKCQQIKNLFRLRRGLPLIKGLVGNTKLRQPHN